MTGSTSGIGAATARLLAARGAHVLVTGRDASRGDAVVGSNNDADGSALFLASDFAADPDELRDFAHQATLALDGRVDLLVHTRPSAPLPTPKGSLTATWALAVKVRAPHVLTAALVPGMIDRGNGVIITIGSWMASVGSPIVGLYSATKAAQEQLTRSWAAEFGPRGIRCVTVTPGASTAGSAGDELDALAAGTPAGRTLRPAAIAGAVAWLASEEAAFLNGATLPVDGGISTTRLG